MIAWIQHKSNETSVHIMWMSRRHELSAFHTTQHTDAREHFQKDSNSFIIRQISRRCEEKTLQHVGIIENCFLKAFNTSMSYE